MERVRTALEACESPQSFFLLHSLGGGTGSGLGTYVLAQLHDAFPELYRFVTRERAPEAFPPHPVRAARTAGPAPPSLLGLSARSACRLGLHRAEGSLPRP